VLNHAFKEWAVVCRALADGHQAVILRKGGIAEAGGEFQAEHTRFWLFPTYVHQQRAGIRPKALPLLEQVEAERPSPAIVRLTEFAVAPRVYRLADLDAALALQDLHIWSEETIRSRFAYRSPGLFVLPARVYRAAETFELPNTEYYAGCKSWVELERELPDESAEPAVDDHTFQAVLQRLDAITSLKIT
jgi:hypothetical protein